MSQPDRIALPLRLPWQRRDGARLALPLGEGGNIPLPPKPKTVRLSSCGGVRTAPVVDISACLPTVATAVAVGGCLPAHNSPVADIALCQRHAIRPVPTLGNCHTTRISIAWRIASCQRIHIGGYPALAN